MLNNKGFTIIELIMSFAFVSVLSASLFAVVVNYKEKQQDASIKSSLLSFKSKLTIDIQSDIQTKVLESIEYCVDDDGNRENRCVNFIFKNGETKKLEVKEETKEDVIDSGDGHTEPFSYQVPYIVYGEIRYTPPDAANLVLNNSYLLNYSAPEDGVENGMTIYKVYINFEHVDLDADIDISIVATGNKFINDGTATEYGVYNVGDRVKVQLGAVEERWFRVMVNSGTFENKLILLSEDNIYENCPASGGSCTLNYGSSVGNIAYSSFDVGNGYDQSNVKYVLDKLSINYDWKNPDVIRIPSAEEIGYLVYACPKYQEEDSGDITLSSAPSWVYNTGNYWTMTPKLYSNNDNNGKDVWYVNSGTKTLTATSVEASIVASIRPVIEIRKDFVLEHVSA